MAFGVGIKSIQRGTQDFATGDTTKTITLSTEVDADKAFSLITRMTAADAAPSQYCFHDVLSDTTLVVTRNTSGSTATVKYQVIEFY